MGERGRLRLALKAASSSHTKCGCPGRLGCEGGCIDRIWDCIWVSGVTCWCSRVLDGGWGGGGWLSLLLLAQPGCDEVGGAVRPGGGDSMGPLRTCFVVGELRATSSASRLVSFEGLPA